jgi:hypothetical protein
MIGEFVKFIESLRVEQILAVFSLYLIFLWLLVPIWVYLDSRKKFNNIYLSILLFVLVLPLNIPGLLFYIIIRPNEFESLDDIPNNYNLFNVPIVNFVTDKKELVMGIELKVNGNILKPEVARDLNLAVHLEHSEQIELKHPEANITTSSSSFADRLNTRVKNIGESLSIKIKDLKARLKTDSAIQESTELDSTKVERIEIDNSPRSASDESQSNNSHHKHKKKKKKKNR